MSSPLQQADFVANEKIMTAMDDAMSNCQQIKSAVQAAAQYLETNWKGGAAAQFQQSIVTWTQALEKVQGALDGLHASTTDYHKRSQNVESSNTSVASWI